MTVQQEEGLAKRRLRALEKARKAAAARRKAGEREACARVRAYMVWLRAGSKVDRIPEIPSNADFTIARRRGVVK